MSTPSAQGLLHSTTQPLVTAGANSLASVVQVLGPPNISFPHSADSAQAVETLTLQRILENKNAYQGFSIVTLMESANPAMLELFPTKLTNTLTHVQDFYEFPKEMAMHTSPGAAPGQSGTAKTTRTWTLTQYNFGQSTTVQELRTTEGQFVWKGKLIILAIAFIEVAEMLVVQCLLDTPSYYAEYFVHRGLHEIDLARAGRMKDLFFDILHRSDNGMAELVNAVRQDMSGQRSIMPTHMLIAEGVAGLAITKRHMDYYMNGPGAAQNAQQIADAFPDVYDGIRIIKVRALDYREKRLHINLLERQTQIGQNFAIDFFHPGADLGKWSSNWLTIAVYSMETDGLAYIGLEECIERCGRFHKGDGNLTHHHYQLAKNWRDLCSRANLPIQDHQIDMFIYQAHDEKTQQSTFNVATIFGHMEPWALSDETIERTSTTIAYYYRNTVGDAALHDIGVGLDNINELYEKTLDDNDVAFIVKASGGTNGRFGVPDLKGDMFQVNVGGAAVRLGPNYKPAGYGTVAGLMAISDADPAIVDPQLIDQAKLFRKAAVAFHKASETLFGRGHYSLDPRYAPAVFKASPVTAQASNFASLINLFTTVVDNNKLPIAKTREAARAAISPEIKRALGTTDAVLDEAITDALTAVPDRVFDSFSPAPNATKFASDYLASPFSQRYAAHLGGPRGRRAASLDVEGAVGAADPALRTFATFVQNELVGRGKSNTEQRAHLLTAVVAAVTGATPSPDVVNAGLLDAWRGAAGPGPLQSAVGGNGVSASALAVSLQSAAGKAAIQFMSPYGGTGILNQGDAALLGDGSGVNDNVLRAGYHIHSQARARPEAEAARAPFTGAVPAPYERQLATDVVGAALVINQVLTARFKRAASKPGWLMRVSQQLFLLASISSDQLHSFRVHNVAPPVAFLLEQPWRRYRTTSAIFLSKPSNTDLGNVLLMDPDMHMGHDAIDKSVFVNMSMYMGAAPRDCQDWYVAHDIAVVGYDGGETATLFDIGLLGKLHAQLAHLPMDGPSILPFMVPAGSLVDKHSPVKVPPTHDIRGYRNAAYYKAGSVERDSQFSKRPMYGSAPFYNTLLQLAGLPTFGTAEWPKYRLLQAVYNTTTHRGYQRIINPHTLTHSDVILPQDQFGESVYPGCRDLRTSLLARHYDPMDYKRAAVPGL